MMETLVSLQNTKTNRNETPLKIKNVLNQALQKSRKKLQDKNAVIAFGGNAFSGKTYDEQMQSLNKMLKPVAEMIREGVNVTITHGNGPQIGEELLKNMYATQNNLTDKPMDVHAASTQGQLGYAIGQSLQNILKDRLDIKVANLVTEVIIDQNDPKSLEPVKPIGPWYDEKDAEKLKVDHPDWVIEKRINPKSEEKTFRRIVSSPIPIGFTNIDAMKTLKENNFTVIASGGGGIPVIYNNQGERQGVAGVIDKDRAAAKLGNQLNIDNLIILTNVANVCINYKKPNQQILRNISPVEALVYDYRGHFEKGSMAPKVEASIDFINGGGKKVIITDGDNLKKAIKGDAGTIIESDVATRALLRWKERFIKKHRAN